MVDNKIIGIENTGNGAKILVQNGSNFRSIDMPKGIIRLDELNYDDIFVKSNSNLRSVNDSDA